MSTNGTIEIVALEERIQALEAERDAYAAHAAALVDRHNEALNSLRIEKGLVDHMCVSFASARAAIQVWASLCPCRCSACQTLSAHLRKPA